MTRGWKSEEGLLELLAAAAGMPASALELGRIGQLVQELEALVGGGAVGAAPPDFSCPRRTSEADPELVDELLEDRLVSRLLAGCDCEE